MSYKEAVRLIPQHKDIFGTPAFSENEVIELLKGFSAPALCHFCSKLMLLLNNSAGQTQHRQLEIIKGLLDSQSKKRLQEFLISQEADLPRTTIFHHIPVLTLLKLNLLHNDEFGEDINTEASRAKAASLLMSLTDLWIPDTGYSRERKHFKRQFRIFSAKQFLLEGNEPLINLMARGRYLLDKVRVDPALDFDGIFYCITGITVDLYLDILVMVMVDWVTGVDLENVSGVAVRDTKRFFEKSDLSEDEIEKFMALLSFQADEFPSLNEKMLLRANLKRQDTRTNFIAFIDKPILRYGSNFMCISPSLLALKFVEGPYRIVNEVVKESSHTNKLTDLWGVKYEEYINERLATTFGKNFYPDIRNHKGEQILDGLVDLGDHILLIETKYPHWSFEARMSGRRGQMRNYLERIALYKPRKEKGKIVDKKKGLGQIKHFVELVDSGLAASPVDLNGRSLIPVLVLGENFPSDSLNREYLEGHAWGNWCLIKDKRVLPFLVLGSEEIELIESLVERKGTELVKQLLVEYSKSLDSYRKATFHYKEHPTSFKNEIYFKGINIPNNKFLLTKSKELFNSAGKHLKK